MNRITIIGRLACEPEIKTTQSGIYVCKFRVAVNRRFNKDETDFFHISAWRDLGVNCNKYLTKGSKVAIIGELQIQNYEQDGIKKTAVNVQADEVEFLSYHEEKNESIVAKSVELEEIDAGDLPF